MVHQENGVGANGAKSANKNGGGSGKKVSKKAKRREERARQQRKTVSPATDEAFSDSEQLKGNGQTTDAQLQDSKKEEIHHQQNGEQPTTATTAASKEVEAVNKEPAMRIPKGLPNLGNTCFFNSTMQCLLTNWPFLCHYFESVKMSHAVHVPSPFNTRVYDTEVKVPTMELHLQHDFPMPTFWSFAKFVEHFHTGDIRPNPHGLFDQISKKVPRFRGMAQQDAHELLHYLMDMLRQEEVSRVQQAFATVQCEGEGDDDGEDQQQQMDCHETTSLVDKTPQQKGDEASAVGQGTSNDKHRHRTRQQTNKESSTNRTSVSRRERRRRLICQALLDGPARPVLDAIYGGVLEQTIKCDRCAHVSVALEPFFDLSLSVKAIAANSSSSSVYASSYASTTSDGGAPSLESALRLFTAAEVLRGDTHAYRCANCTKPKKPKEPTHQQAEKQREDDDKKSILLPAVNALKRYKVLSPPLVLTLHINRFVQNGRNWRKFNGHVQFPLVLNLSPFCSSNVKRLRSGQHRRLLLYRLCGVVSHSGGMNSGHYIAYVGRYPPRSDGDGSHCQSVDNLFKLARHCPTSAAPNALADQVGTLTLENSNLNKDRSTNNTMALHQQSATDGGDEDSEKEAEGDDDEPSVSTSGTGVSANVIQVQEIEQQALEAAMQSSKWFYCSDSSVRSVKVGQVLNAQAFLLFYERIY